MKEINVIYAGNRAMIEGILLSVMSLSKNNQSSKINIYVLTLDLTDLNSKYYPIVQDDCDNILKAAQIYNPNVTIRLIDNDPEIVKNKDLLIKLDGFYTPYTLLRLFLDKIENIPNKILYLDCDVMINGSLDELFSYDNENYAVMAALDHLGKFWMRFRSEQYFNAGVLLLNIKKIKELDICNKAIKLLSKKRYHLGDQDVLNIICKETKSCKIIPSKFNEQRGMKGDTVIKHFCRGIKWLPFFQVYNIKQWEINKVYNILKIHQFDDIFEKYKSFREEFLEGNYILRVRHLFKTYGDVKAVNDVSFKVKTGSLFAFLGVNGAGKSTTINIISSILKKDSGSVYVCGYDLDKNNDEIKKQIGIVFQNSVLDSDLTVEENLKIRTSFYSMKDKEKKEKLSRIIDLLELKPILKRQIKKLSGGQKRRVDIARAMVHEPKLLILDEPTTGLDPKTRLNVWSLIDDIRKKTGMTVFLTTHYLEEADQATFVTIINKRKIIAEGSQNKKKNKYSSDAVIAYLKKDEDFEKILTQNSEKFIYDNDKKAYKILAKDSLKAKQIINNYAYFIKDFEIIKGTMDDVFLNVTGKNIVFGGNEDGKN